MNEYIRPISLPLIIFYVIALFSCSGPQESKEEVKVYLINELDEPPQFQGGYEEFITFITEGVKNAPEGTFDSLKEKVFIDFVIDKEGKVSQIAFKRPLPLAIEKELKSILAKSPNWKPGKVKGESVASLQTLPIKFSE